MDPKSRHLTVFSQLNMIFYQATARTSESPEGADILSNERSEGASESPEGADILSITQRGKVDRYIYI